MLPFASSPDDHFSRHCSPVRSLTRPSPGYAYLQRLLLIFQLLVLGSLCWTGRRPPFARACRPASRFSDRHFLPAFHAIRCCSQPSFERERHAESCYTSRRFRSWSSCFSFEARRPSCPDGMCGKGLPHRARYTGRNPSPAEVPGSKPPLYADLQCLVTLSELPPLTPNTPHATAAAWRTWTD